MDFGVVSTPLSCFLGVLRFLRAINTDTAEGWRLGKRGCGRSQCLTEEKDGGKKDVGPSPGREPGFFIPSFFFLLEKWSFMSCEANILIAFRCG